MSRRRWTHLGFFLLSSDRSLAKNQHSSRTRYNVARKARTPGYCWSPDGGRAPGPPTGLRALSCDPGENAREGRVASTPPARGYCSRRGLAALWPSPRARCRPGFLTLGRRRTPAPIRAPTAPSTLSALAPFKPSSQVPRRAHPETRVPYRESTAPSPSRRRPHPSARGRGQNGRLVSSHETKKAPPLPPSEGKPGARARPPQPPPHHAARAPAARALVTSPQIGRAHV